MVSRELMARETGAGQLRLKPKRSERVTGPNGAKFIDKKVVLRKSPNLLNCNTSGGGCSRFTTAFSEEKLEQNVGAT